MVDVDARPIDRAPPDIPVVLSLDDPRAGNAALTGAKGANLVRAAAAGVPTLPGFVVTTAAPAGLPSSWATTDLAALRRAWETLGATGHPLVVRSSSTVEDVGTSSMAGQFRSVLDVTGWDGFLAAADAVRQSAHRPGAEADRPMAVLVQPQLRAHVSGVMFGVDPVTGDADRIVVEAVAGNPDTLVSGQVTAHRLVLDRRGHIRALDGAPVTATHRMLAHPLLTRHDCRALATLAAAVADEFGTPQDVEWALDDRRRLWLLQSRPVTAVSAPVSGPVLGPGPVAETFPYPLRPLECDLWLAPMREGITQALLVVGVVPRRHLTTSPVVTCVNGWVAADLELFGYVPGRRGKVRWIDPRPPARRLAAAMRIGGVRASLPNDVAEAVASCDSALSATSPLEHLSDQQLLATCGDAVTLLTRLHTLEVLAATLTASSPASVTGTALRALAEARRTGTADAATTAHHPVVLALTPPHVGAPWPLPAVPAVGPRTAPEPPGLRELVRLRARWVQELSARAATELGRRLTAAGRLPDPEAVAWLSLAELAGCVRGAPAPEDLVARRELPPGAPLPSHFRFAAEGRVVAVERPGARPSGGVGAGGGRGVGRVVNADAITPDAQREPGSGRQVLVVRSMDPTLAARLPGLAGLVAESGSTLSHLAILAREYDVPTVVGVHDAMHRFPVGILLLVDGATGEVRALDDREANP